VVELLALGAALDRNTRTVQADPGQERKDERDQPEAGDGKIKHR
jgi:hypothetical protein